MTTKAANDNAQANWLIANCAFSGDLFPTVDAAVEALTQAGYHLNRAPEEIRARADVEGDDYLEVRVIGDEDEIGTFMRAVEAIVREHGGCCFEAGGIDPETPPFANGPY
jgi:hypothetical protein